MMRGLLYSNALPTSPNTRFGPSTRSALLVASLLSILLSFSTDAASAFQEEFTSSLSGWTHQDQGTLVQVSGEARLSFGALPIPLPLANTMAATSAASGAAFSGDYTTAGISVIGFSFRAEHVLPAELVLSITGGINNDSFTIDIVNLPNNPVAQTGVTYDLVFSLASMAAGGWQRGGSPTEADFLAVLADVDEVAIKLIRGPGLAAQDYFVDNVFIDSLPVISALAPQTDGSIDLDVDFLQVTQTYRLYSAPTAAGPYVPLGAPFVAGFSSLVVTDLNLGGDTLKSYAIVME